MADDTKLNPLRDEIRMEDIEQAIIYNGNGDVVLRKKGVSLSDEEYDRLKAAGKEVHRDFINLSKADWQIIIAGFGIGLIHNHPFTHESIFSDKDIRTLLVSPILKIVETVTADGTFILRKTNKPITPNLRRKVLGTYDDFWNLYSNFLNKNAKNIEQWGKEGIIPPARAYAYLAALDRIISLGATKKAVDISANTISLEYIPLNEVFGKKIEQDFTVIEAIDNALQSVEIPKVKPGQKLRIEGPGEFPFSKERLVNKKPSDHVYSPKGMSTERRKL